MKAIIPIGGRGTRLRPITFSANKHFIPVANKPLIFYPIETIVSAGITDIAITYNPGQLEYAQKTLGDGSKWGARFTYILQSEPKGLAKIYQVCEEWVGDDKFVLHLGDNIFTEGIKEAVAHFLKEGSNGLVVMVRHAENKRLGVPYFNDKGELIKYVEKPDNPPHDFAIPGIYFLDKNAFKVFKGRDSLKLSARGEYEIPDAYQWLIDHGYKISVKEYIGKWLDPGKFGDWIETNRYLLDTSMVNGEYQQITPTDSKIEGRVKIGENCQIKGSHVRGPVIIGDNVSIIDSFVGPFSSIYNNCHLQSCHLENSVLMDSVTIQNISKPIDSSLIGPSSRIVGHNNSKLEFFVGELTAINL